MRERLNSISLRFGFQIEMDVFQEKKRKFSMRKVQPFWNLIDDLRLPFKAPSQQTLPNKFLHSLTFSLYKSFRARSRYHKLDNFPSLNDKKSGTQKDLKTHWNECFTVYSAVINSKIPSMDTGSFPLSPQYIFPFGKERQLSKL